MKRLSFAEFEHEGWQRVANKYVGVWGQLTSQFAQPILDAARVKSGMFVLDVACGPGYVSAAASERGTVIGLDFSRTMVEQARRLYPSLRFEEGDAHQLPFENSSFDAVVMNFGVLHLSEPVKAFAEAYRVLKPGGRFAFTLWALPEKSAGSKAINDAIDAHIDRNVELPEGPSVYLFCDPEECNRQLRRAGFTKSFQFDMVTVLWKVPSVQFVFDAEKEAGVRTAALLKEQTADTLAAIRENMERNLEQFKTPDGLSLPMAAHVISAQK